MEKSPKARTRKINYQFKILYAIGIISVLIYHLGIKSTIRPFIDWFAYNPFVLALFVFCSGYFYKNKNEDHPFKYIMKKVKRLIVPLLLWNLFYAGIVLLLSVKEFTIGREISIDSLLFAPFRDGHQFVYNLGSWFIAPLFSIELVNILTRIAVFKKLKPFLRDVLLLISSFCLGAISVHLATNGLTKGWLLLLTRTFFLFPFFEIGVIYKNYLETRDKLPNIIYYSLVIIAALIINTICGHVPEYTVSTMTGFNGSTLFPYLSALIPIAFWLRTSKILTPLIGNNRIINTIADNTYTIMVNHILGFMLVKTFFAILTKIVSMAPAFDWTSYKSNIWYYYYPFNNHNFSIIYLVAGITLPIIMQKIAHYLYLLIRKKIIHHYCLLMI